MDLNDPTGLQSFSSRWGNRGVWLSLRRGAESCRWHDISCPHLWGLKTNSLT